jgi:hypothetical protein
MVAISNAAMHSRWPQRVKRTGSTMSATCPVYRRSLQYCSAWATRERFRADDFWLGRRRWSGTQNSRVLDCAHLFAGSHPKLARFGIGVALNRAGLASGNFCCANSAVNAATLCSASASVAAVPRTCAMSSFKAVLSIPIPLPSRDSATPIIA